MNAEDEEGFREFVALRWTSLLRTAYLLVGDHGHAEDLVQSALVRTHRRWSGLENRDQPERYVRKVLVNLASSHWRRRLHFRESPVADVPERTVADATAHSDLRDELWQALRSLPPRMRAVLVLRYFEDLSEAEIAAVLGCSTGTVKSQASRGLARLRAGLTDEATYTIRMTRGVSA
ncbi:RNA polymerase sigma-70 factor, sigma-E family [Actinopolymorpha cephalotaxi]|uniref:RNA polymerase sigma-70 factor (Sigma-E family) n=1 Tax=Actinopolymorpha cephalotaxi TaxID=504797 RepID=A0A1I2N876_9ACTN|nr:SigE family RNA polymerase sigma factor [Actinopolymorpha cephalotaxi]NYH85648.1 RNA polymerase sigma-70 factor (sigma-E family) [Actinopolymorpha cephalotaxi]SFF99668.1 RNA polymerase sigma-70 factor, sigma-E family [Actinopolymorpha cephalotaxi]